MSQSIANVVAVLDTASGTFQGLQINGSPTILSVGGGGGAGTVTKVAGVSPDGSGNVALASTSLTDGASLNTAISNAQSTANAAATQTSLNTTNTNLSNLTTTVNGKISSTLVGAANGIAGLDGTSKVPVSQLPAAVLGSLNYQGGWNASTNTPTLVSSLATKGFYYLVTVAGNTSLGGITQWNVGDKAVDNGTSYEKIDGVGSEVLSVGGMTGVVSLSLSNLTDGATQQTAITSAGTAAAAAQATANAAIPSSQKGTASGVAPLDSNSKIPVANLPTALVQTVAGRSGAVTISSSDLTDLASVITTPISNNATAAATAQATANAAIPAPKLTWNANSNTPALASATLPVSGVTCYTVTTAGTTTLDGNTNWKVNDIALYVGTAWQKISFTAGAPVTTALLKGDGTGYLVAATAGTDYVIPSAVPTIANSGLLKGNGSGSAVAAVAGTDYAVPSAVPTIPNSSAILKGNGTGGVSSATSGTDYLAPSVIPSSSAIFKGNGSGGLVAAVAGTDYAVPGGLSLPVTTYLFKGDNNGGALAAVPNIDYSPPNRQLVGVPVILPPSGTVGTNGAVTFNTAFTDAIPNSWMYFPANTIIGSGQSAGFYFVTGVTAGGTTGTVWNNTYTPSTLTVPGVYAVPASPTAFSGTGTTFSTPLNSYITAVAFIVKANSIGPNGSVRCRAIMRNNPTATKKSFLTNYGSATLGPSTDAQSTAVSLTGLLGTFQNTGVLTAQIGLGNELVSSTGTPQFGAINSGSDQLVTYYLRISTAATDWVGILAGGIEVTYGA